MTIAKLIVAYPRPLDVEAFEKVYTEEHVPLAVAKLAGRTKIVTTRVLGSQEGRLCIIELQRFIPSMGALEVCAASPRSIGCTRPRRQEFKRRSTHCDGRRRRKLHVSRMSELSDVEKKGDYCV